MDTPTPDITALTDESLWCRTERHLWKWQNDWLDPDNPLFERTLNCERCGAIKTKTISLRTFLILRTSIKYPKNYLVHGGRLSMPEVYREQYENRRK